ncbi:hypothetical protein NCS57_01207700 [Fusarium keratoplasticum]|uniref:Uncharacterized protein n=1 Tax=Fusarium keratoplasticum TaxID=1328300 RepID=A0ACC0QJX1_9HYPO|nr:hypothetical protein NCS57_01207700 [Fusarium keratoplasticum]KAI8654611.1 hypothetical protein NCS57_01207700 [Fusarium keratoplasticum]KAI8655471.1 hypothetical protein NCS55_01199200 [Fusarium keratoplasticum]
MLPNILFLALVWSTQTLLVSGRSAFLRTRSLPGSSGYDTWKAMRRAFAGSGLHQRDTTEKSISLDKSWEDATLLAFTIEQNVGSNSSVSAGIEITCATCYTKGTATTKFIYDGDFNISNAFENFTNQVESEVRSLATQVTDYVEEYVDGVVTKLDDGVDLDDFDLPPMDVNFNIDLPEIPEFRLQFQFDGLEMYMLIDTVLSAGATYTLNLYTSTTPVGFAVSDNLEVGVIFTIDLILSVEGEINISSGFHLRLDDGVVFELGIFSEEIASIAHNGGEFEFLPVTVESAGVVFKAILCVGVQVGFEVGSNDLTILGKGVAKVGAGVEMGLYANIAEFITNVTLSMDEDDDCRLHVEEGYQLAVGLAGGASVAIQNATWGPVLETETPIFYTTLAEVCAIQRSRSTPSAAEAIITSAALEARDEDEDQSSMETTTISTKETFVVVACLEDLTNCPVSLQKTSKYTTTRTHVTVIPTDSEAKFPDSVRNTVASVIPFGDGANKLAATSGAPKSFVPSSTETGAPDDDVGISNQNTGGVSNSVIIGVSVGLGVPLLLGGFATVFFLRKKRLSARATLAAPVETVEPALPSVKATGPSVVEQRVPQ